MKKLRKNKKKNEEIYEAIISVGDWKNYCRFKELEGYKNVKYNNDTLVNDYLTKASFIFKSSYEKSKYKKDETTKLCLELSEEIEKFKKENEGKNIFEIKDAIENSKEKYFYKANGHMSSVLNSLLGLIDIKTGMIVDDEIDKRVSLLYNSLKMVFKKEIISTNILKLFFVFLLPYEGLFDLLCYYIIKHEKSVNEYDFYIMKFILEDNLYLYE